MKKVLLLGRRDFGEKNNVADMASQLRPGSDDVHYRYAYYDQLVVYITSEQQQITLHHQGEITDLADFDLVIFINWTANRVLSDIAATTAQYVQAHGGECWSSELLSARAMTKLSQLYRAAKAGVVVAESVFSLNHTLIAEAAKRLPGAEVVAKDIEASRGRRNLKSAKDALAETLAPYHTYPMIVQRFIPNDGSDLRFVVFGGEVGVTIRRSGDGSSHLTNLSAGGSGEVVASEDLPAELMAQVRQLSLLFHREICGIDYMYDTLQNRYIFLEINTTPQLTNGAFAAQKMNRLRQVINDRLGKR